MPLRGPDGRFISPRNRPTATWQPPNAAPTIADYIRIDDDEEFEYYSRCTECDDGLSEEDVYYGPDNNHYCQNCFDARWRICDECNETFLPGDMVEYDHGTVLCPGCNSDSQHCDRCQRVFGASRLTEIDGERRCGSCTTGAHRCSRCGHRSFQALQFISFYHIGNQEDVKWCRECYKSYSKQYATPTQRCFYCQSKDYSREMMTKEIDMLSGQANFMCPRCKSSRTARMMVRALPGLPGPTNLMVKRPYGVEIESNNAYSRQLLAQQFGFIVVRDGSVASHNEYAGMNGELVSPVMTDDSSLAVIKYVMDSGIVADRSCGYHLHIAPVDYDWFDIGKLLYWCKRWEYEFGQMCPGRYGNNYCHKLPDFDADDLLNSKRQMDVICKYFAISKDTFTQVKKSAGGFNAQAKTGIRFGRSTIGTSRYTWVNLNSYLWRGTIEIRLHQGVSNADDAVNWIKLWQGIFEWLKRAGSVDVATAEFASCFPTRKIREFYFERARSAYGDNACAVFSDVSVDLGKPCPKPLP